MFQRSPLHVSLFFKVPRTESAPKLCLAPLGQGGADSFPWDLKKK